MMLSGTADSQCAPRGIEGHIGARSITHPSYQPETYFRAPLYSVTKWHYQLYKLPDPVM